MYQNIFVERKTKTVHLWDDQIGYQTLPLQNYAYRKRSGGRYKSIYGDELEKVTWFDPRDPSLFEADVPMETKVLIDIYAESEEASTGHRVGFIDIETDMEGGFPTVDKGDKEITAIALYDSVSKKYIAFLLDKENRSNGNPTNRSDTDVICKDNEYNLLAAFLNKWEELAFTIVTGWNIDGFDMPYLYHRITNVLGQEHAKRLSSIGICYINDYTKRLVVAGTSCLDYMELFKKYTEKREPSYALGAIGKKVVKMDKIQYEGNLNDLYRSDINKYLDYNINDVEIVVALDKKLKYIELAQRICHKGHVPYESFAMSSRYLEGAFLTYLRNNGYRVAPNKPVGGREEYEQRLEDNEEGFEGAYVKDPVLGLHEWVYDLDMTSMYPRIIMSLNISPETKAGKVDNWDVEKFVSGELKQITIAGTPYSIEEFKSMLKNENLAIASNGCMYRQDKPGVIPTLLTKWFDERKELRKLEKKYLAEGNHEMYDFYYQRQLVQKIMLNSAYGVLGLPLFRFYDKDNAEAVTKTGVTLIQNVGKFINQYYNKEMSTSSDKDWVIYTDTDSCFTSALPIIKHRHPNIDRENEAEMTKATLSVCTEVQSYVNKMFDVIAKSMFNLDKHGFDAKQEVVAKTSFFLAKKRYTQFIINKGGVPLEELEIKGIDVVRTSFPMKFRNFMHKFLVDILKKIDKSMVDASILDFQRDVENSSIVEVAKNTSVKFISQDKAKNYDPPNRAPFNFVLGTPAQVKAGLAYNDLLVHFKLNKKYQKILNGQKIKWVYLTENTYGLDAIAMKADGTDPKQMLEFIESYIDKKAMYEKELKGKLQDFYIVMNWVYPDANTFNASKFFSFD
jgi:DNA polymerase elongation subunit (family B)